MGSPRRLSSFISLALLPLLLCLSACGSDSEVDPYESETTRAIREKVQANMERQRLERAGRRLAALNETLVNSPNAYQLAASTSDEGSGGADEASGTPLERGEAAYTQYCASCHGARGHGDGPLGASLVPQPAKHSDGTYMNALSNEHIFKVIQQGGLAVGKSSMMAPWGTTLSDDRIRDVIEFIRSLADPPYAGETP